MDSRRTVSIIGTGSYVPEKVLTNKDLESIVDTTDEWIYSRTGMRERHIAAADQATSDLGAAAAKKALADAGIGADELDLVIVATLSPDMFFPSTACFVQEKIGAKNAFCFDLGAACSGFLYALDNAKNQIACGAIDTALVIGSEKMSTFIDWEDRGTCILFGDGAGAAVLRAGGEGRGVMQSAMGSDGSLANLLWTPGGGSRNPISQDVLDNKQQYLQMQGREVFKHAVIRMTESVLQALEKNGLEADDIGCFIPHQANIRIIDAISKRLGVGDRMYVNVDKYANTSSAALAIALDEATKDGTIQKGDLVVLTVFGGGFTWGASVLEWGK
ncbi:beta-ketoacyl-ACP synthase III [Pontiella sulfatireligans]|uniref:Beta-ketoacyl-[acyl-carrier-protein] synthase III n=1 Tax=Pontiella sulfatireligans TaxID=2750658 RepID=A0A6C2UKF0_9BACT|nr:beta-ketoacyl-ACP synthase III [Pontiella sulfatireligans]VGO20578.1 3-oxoacyl-[acyl-carrier-protein] synthase 3 [Pontiella sulfatireligans]